MVDLPVGEGDDRAVKKVYERISTRLSCPMREMSIFWEKDSDDIATMAFGPIHWFASFVIFFIVLGIITWSAVHLGKKDHNSTDIVVRFLDLDDYLILKGQYVSFCRKRRLLLFKLLSLYRFSKSLSTEDNSSTSRVIESTDDPTPNHQGYEISNIIEFYKVLQALSSTQNHTASGSMQNDNTTAVSATSVVANDSTWSENSTVTARQSSEPLVLDNRRPVSEKEIEL